VGGVDRGDGDVEQSVVVEILHDRASSLVESVDARQVADVPELTDVELRVAESIQRDPESRIDLPGMLAQGHVGQVEQPTDPQVFRENLEVFGEVADRQAGAGRVRVNGGRSDGEDARALPTAFDAIVVLTATHRGDTLEVNDGVEPSLREMILDFG